MDLQALLPVLLSWAVHLSDYPMPDAPPAVRYVGHEFFVEHVCGGRDCPAWGWYNDSDVIFVDERLRDGAPDFAAALLVHELTHYLQHKSGRFDSLSCEDSVKREREAYRVQYQYMVEGRGMAPLSGPRPMSCNYRAAGGSAGSGPGSPASR